MRRTEKPRHEGGLDKDASGYGPELRNYTDWIRALNLSAIEQCASKRRLVTVPGDSCGDPASAISRSLDSYNECMKMLDLEPATEYVVESGTVEEITHQPLKWRETDCMIIRLDNGATLTMMCPYDVYHTTFVSAPTH